MPAFRLATSLISFRPCIRASCRRVLSRCCATLARSVRATGAAGGGPRVLSRSRMPLQRRYKAMACAASPQADACVGLSAGNGPKAL